MPLAATYLDNTSNLSELSDYGVKISKIGFDASTAADKDLLFNASWPSMQIVKTMQFDGSTFSYPHELGFPPFALLLDPDNEFRAMVNLPVDDTNVYVPTTESGTATIVVYNLNLTVDVEYPYTTKSGSTSPYNYDNGIKIAKLGSDIDSQDMRDFILHTRCGSPMVLAVKTQETVNEVNPTIVQYTNRIGYQTLNFGYIKIKASSNFPGVVYTGNDKYYAAPLQSQASPQTFTDGITTYVLIGGTPFDDGATVVCLRNPAISLTNAESVTY